MGDSNIYTIFKALSTILICRDILFFTDPVNYWNWSEHGKTDLERWKITPPVSYLLLHYILIYLFSTPGDQTTGFD